MPDWWTAFQFDNAVMQFGAIVENRLQETEDHYVNGRVEKRFKFNTADDVFKDAERAAKRKRGDVFVDYIESLGMVVER